MGFKGFPSCPGFPEDHRHQEPPNCLPHPSVEPQAPGIPLGHSGEGAEDWRTLEPALGLAVPGLLGPEHERWNWMPPGGYQQRESGRSCQESPRDTWEPAECHQRGQGLRCLGQLGSGWGCRGALPWGPQHMPLPGRGMEAAEVAFGAVVSGQALFERGWSGPGAGWQLRSWQTPWRRRGRKERGEIQPDAYKDASSEYRAPGPPLPALRFARRVTETSLLFKPVPRSPRSFPGPGLHFHDSDRPLSLPGRF